tara:strand:+ start:253 stop:447 length:195 start_codon:yes stop_codon:yes gene_type:complete
MEQTIENFEGTKNIHINSGGKTDLEVGIQFIYDMREHPVDILIATVYAIVVYAIIMWITKKFRK